MGTGGTPASDGKRGLPEEDHANGRWGGQQPQDTEARHRQVAPPAALYHITFQTKGTRIASLTNNESPIAGDADKPSTSTVFCRWVPRPCRHSRGIDTNDGSS